MSAEGSLGPPLWWRSRSPRWGRGGTARRSPNEEIPPGTGQPLVPPRSSWSYSQGLCSSPAVTRGNGEPTGAGRVPLKLPGQARPRRRRSLKALRGQGRRPPQPEEGPPNPPPGPCPSSHRHLGSPVSERETDLEGPRGHLSGLGKAGGPVPQGSEAAPTLDGHSPQARTGTV